MTRRINDAALAKIKQWEGFEPKAKPDVGGVLTSGYGHTGADVHPGMLIDEAHAEILLLNDLGRFEERVEKLVTVPLTDNQFAALVSFDFNTGALDKSTLLKELNKGNYDCVPFELAKWNKATIDGKKVVVKGLANRRAVEAALWAEGEHISSNSAPVDVPSKPIITLQSASLAVPIVAGVGSAIGDAGPLFTGAGPVQWALAGLVLIAAIVGAVLFIHKHTKTG